MRAQSSRITAPLRTSRGYRRYYASMVANALGSGIATGAVSMTILDTGGGATGIAMLLLAQVGTQVLLMPVSGAAADRVPRRLLLVGSLVVFGVIGAAQTVLAATDTASVAALAVLGAVTFAVSSFILPAQEGVVRSLVSLEHLREANALAKLTRYSATIVGPSVGGVLVAAFGTSVTLGVDAVSYYAAAALMARVPVPALKRSPTMFRTDVAEMWTIAVSRRWLWVNVLAGAFGVACWHIGYGIVGITYVRAHLGGPAAWGAVASCLGGGMVAGAVVSLVWPPVRAGWRNNLGCVPMLLPDALMALRAPLWAVGAGVAAAAAGMSIAAVAWRAILQQEFPDAQQGRVSAVAWTGELVIAPLGYPVVPVLLSAFGTRGTLAVCSAGMALGALAPLTVPSCRRLRLHTTTSKTVPAARTDGAGRNDR
ncbi:MFS transporter [Actinomadura logoneensis]|uniref:MFS transporter n=1 Tax=Actinomadura logoneensis TaxID=2293572 RepID=UPI001314A88A|nr:MFS transporter [Actinomadura logoneensis]